jgi:HEPN domain-containing protein
MNTLSPIVLAQHAQEFLAASERESSAGLVTTSMPAYFLAARAIELGLKSYLLTRGHDERALRKISHDLGEVFDQALTVDLRSVTSCTPEEEHCLRWINAYYESKDLEYPKTGFKSYPPLHYLTDFAKRLLQDLQPTMRAWGLARPKVQRE